MSILLQIVWFTACLSFLSFMRHQGLTDSTMRGVQVFSIFLAVGGANLISRWKEYTWPHFVIVGCVGLILGYTLSLDESFLRTPYLEIVWGVVALLLVGVGIYSERHFRRSHSL